MTKSKLQYDWSIQRNEWLNIISKCAVSKLMLSLFTNICLMKFTGSNYYTGRLKFGDDNCPPTLTYKLKEVQNTSIPTDDVWHTENICKKIVRQNPAIGKRTLPGAGERYAGEYFQKWKKKDWFVAPINRLLQEEEVEATTQQCFSFAVHEGAGQILFKYNFQAQHTFNSMYKSRRKGQRGRRNKQGNHQ